MRKRNTAKGTLFRTALLVLWASAGLAPAAEFRGSWSAVPDRIWVGPECWANRLQDWRVSGGRLECVIDQAAKPMRTVHLLTHTLGGGRGAFTLGVRTGLIDERGQPDSTDAATGFLVGAGRGLDYRAAALIHHSGGENAGLFAGIDAKGFLFIRDFSAAGAAKAAKSVPKELARADKSCGEPRDLQLRLRAEPADPNYVLTLSAHDPKTGQELSQLVLKDIDPTRLIGHVALVSHPGSGKGGRRFWFNDWTLFGTTVQAHEGRECGPILCTQYTLHRNILKLTAQMMPLGEADNQTVILQAQRLDSSEKWVTVASTKVIAPGWTAPFRVEKWDSSHPANVRVLYELKRTDGATKQYIWPSTVRRDPVEAETIVVAAFTGNHNVRGGVDQGRYTWTDQALWFPHNEVVEHVRLHQPDLLFFSGDNVYEGASPTAPDRSGRPSSLLDYLYKWYLWCWAYRDLAREIPCVAVPDDHDIFQGNLWGAGGRKTDLDDKGGYVMPAEFVKMVERTQASHLPDPYDPTPIEQGIGVYYTALNWGRIGFAILEDRKFKSGPNGLCPPTTSGRADHVIDPNYDPKTFDVPGAQLLGDRQLKFLRDWAADWRGTDMKAALSQTAFAGVATHHGGDLMYLVADLDSNGWPQSGRNQALAELRRCFALMICGDQHLATICHHGIDDWNDAGWSFCVPSIANFYLRAWQPKAAGRNRPEGMPDYTGEFLDGLGNRVTVWAATNPGDSMGREPAALHDKKPGYGIVRFNKSAHTITMECWPRFADPRKDKQYLGWPKTIDQLDNYGRKAAAYLPALRIEGLTDPVVQVIDEADGEIVYTLRIKGATFRPKVFRAGLYTIRVSEPDQGKMKMIEHVRSLPEGNTETLEVRM